MTALPRLSFERGETIEMLRDTVQQFCAEAIAPRAAAIGRDNLFPAGLWKNLGALGLHGIRVKEVYGGSDFVYLAHIVAMEAVSRASASVGLSYGARSNLAVNQLHRNGNEAQKQKYLPKLVSGERVGAGDERAERRLRRCKREAAGRGERRLLCPQWLEDVDHQRRRRAHDDCLR